MTNSYTRRQALAFAALSATAAASSSAALAEQPLAGVPGGFSFLAIGDWGKPFAPGQKLVAAALGKVSDELKHRFVVSLGDNFYNGGVTGIDDPQWQSTFEQVYTAQGLQCPWFAILGNHDRRGEAMAQVAYSQVSSRWKMPSPFFVQSEDVGDGARADFFFLDTTVILREHSGVRAILPGDDADDQMAWLDHSLSASKARWKVVVGHHPIYSAGPHGSSGVLDALVRPTLERHGVAAYFCGHDHNMQHIIQNNIHYFVCGTGADVAKLGPPLPGTKFSSATLGFLRTRVTRNEMLVEFIGVPGGTLHTSAIALTS